MVEKRPTHLRELFKVLNVILAKLIWNKSRFSQKIISVCTPGVFHFYSIQQNAGIYHFYSIQQYLVPGFKIRTWKGFCPSYNQIFVDLVDVGTCKNIFLHKFFVFIGCWYHKLPPSVQSYKTGFCPCKAISEIWNHLLRWI